jgi:hypothetical protein
MLSNFLNISRDQAIALSSIHKFGQNLFLSATSQSVWTEGGVYPWSEFDSGAVTLYAISDNGDTGILCVKGLDNNFDYQEEEITLTSTTAVTLTKQFRRVSRLEYVDTANLGKITVRTGSGTGTVVGSIEPGKNQSLMAVYTVPANTRGYLAAYTVGTGKNDDALVELRTRTFGETFKIKSETKVYQNTHQQMMVVPVFLAPKTDIDFYATTTTANSDVIVNFDLIEET